MEDKIILFDDKSKCSGCEACKNICPQNAISMEIDEYGFIYPKINHDKCVKCGLCKRVCAYQKENTENEYIQVYAAMTHKEDILMKSASGGVFGTIAEEFLNDEGIVYGCSMEIENDVITPKHIRITDKNDLEKLQGSKYVKSKINDVYTNVEEDLKNNKKVLFSGTPCQVDALKSYLKLKNAKLDNLYTIDLICHGTPSTKMFQDYVKKYEKALNGKIINIKFRDKKIGKYSLHRYYNI